MLISALYNYEPASIEMHRGMVLAAAEPDAPGKVPYLVNKCSWIFSVHF